MPYVTPNGVRDVLTRDPYVADGTAAEMSDAAITAHISSAQDTVDVYLSQRYSVPFPDGQVPGLVVDITTAIAAWLATLSHRQTVDVGPAEPVTLRNAWAMNLLSALAKGTADLPRTGVAPDPPPEQSGSGRPINPYAGRLFGVEELGLGYERGDRYSWPYGWR